MSLVASHAADGEIRSSNKALRILRWAAVLVIAVGFAFPLYWVLVTAFNSHSGVFSIPPNFVPSFHADAFLYVLEHTSPNLPPLA